MMGSSSQTENKCRPPAGLSSASGSGPEQPTADFHPRRCAAVLPFGLLDQHPGQRPHVATKRPQWDVWDALPTHRVHTPTLPHGISILLMSCGDTHLSGYPGVEN